MAISIPSIRSVCCQGTTDDSVKKNAAGADNTDLLLSFPQFGACVALCVYLVFEYDSDLVQQGPFWRHGLKINGTAISRGPISGTASSAAPRPGGCSHFRAWM